MERANLSKALSAACRPLVVDSALPWTDSFGNCARPRASTRRRERRIASRRTTRRKHRPKNGKHSQENEAEHEQRGVSGQDLGQLAEWKRHRHASSPERTLENPGRGFAQSTDVVAKNPEATSVLISPGFGVLLERKILKHGVREKNTERRRRSVFAVERRRRSVFCTLTGNRRQLWKSST